MTLSHSLAPVADRIAVLYGSHSGNTERLAKQLHSELKWRLGASVLLSSTHAFSRYDLESLKPNDVVLLLTSTYGDGGPNPNTQLLWNTVLDEALEPKPLRFGFSVLSRGSSLYGNNFARAGIKLNARLSELGAHQIAPLGIQDKIGLDPEEEFFSWKEAVIQSLIKSRGYTEQPYQYEPSVNVFETSGDSDVVKEVVRQEADSAVASPTCLKIKSTRLASTDRDYVYATVQLPFGESYNTGDYVVVWPVNAQSEVDIFLDAMFRDSPRRFNTVNMNAGSRTVPTSYELLARHSIDINGRVERDLLLKLANFAPNDEVKRRTLALMSDKSALQNVTANHGAYNIARLLAWLSPTAPWIDNLPPSAFLDVLPHLTPRRYSISSSSLESPQSASITAVVERDAATGFTGVATGQLNDLISHEGGQGEVMAAVEPVYEFRPPHDPSVPLLMFAVGTGVAPFRGFVRERSLSGAKAGPTVLFVGSRSPEDLVHREEFEAFEADPAYEFKLVPAYSRVDDTHPDKGYIFDKLAEQGDLIWDALQRGAEVYICGDIRKLRRGVRDGLASILAAKQGLAPELGKREFKKLKRAGRIHLDLW